MYYCNECKNYMLSLVIEHELCGVDNMTGRVSYAYCSRCGSSHSGEEVPRHQWIHSQRARVYAQLHGIELTDEEWQEIEEDEDECN